jgi:hypothetical protein
MNENEHRNQAKDSHDDFTCPDGTVYSYDRRTRIYRKDYKRSKKNHPTESAERKNVSFFNVQVRRDWWTFAISTIIALSTFGIVSAYTYYAAKQVAATEDANGTSQKAVRESNRGLNLTLGKMDISNGNTKDVAQLSRDALTKVQRAFIFPTPIVTPQNNPYGFGISIQFDNSGYTPTRDMTMHVSDRVMNDIPKGFNFPDLWNAGEPHVNTPSYIAPKGRVAIFLPIFVPLDAAKASIANRNLPTLYMWGWVKYRDVFNGTKRHQTLFCYKFLAIPNPPDAKGVSSGVSLADNSCPVHNCYDDECKEKN